MFRLVLILILILIQLGVAAPLRATVPERERALIFVMIDGLRWQEVFRGADPELAARDDYMGSPFAAEARRLFVDVPDRRAALMPFLNRTIGSQGVLIGNRDRGSCVALANGFRSSYPGFSEALTGFADPRIGSNDLGPNPNVTFLEWLNRRPAFAGRVRALASWEAFDRIINAERSGVPVNAGPVPSGFASPNMQLVDRLQRDTPRHGDNRLDSFTHAIAVETLATARPRVLLIAYEETDAFAHRGDFAQYLFAANRVDRFIAELWAWTQADPVYAGRTTLIVTADHGRGAETTDEGPTTWRHHGQTNAESAEIWFGALGPGVRAGAEPSYPLDRCAELDQVAATAVTALGEDWRRFNPGAGPPLDIFARRQ
jgi:hypothetical protein